MKFVFVLAALTGLASCESDETISGYSSPDVTWILQEIDGAPFPALATIQFPEKGRVEGQAPCNKYFAHQSAPYPWIEVGDIGATKMACADLNAETAFFSALSQMTLAEVLADTLILSDETGLQMVFRAGP